MTCVRSWRLCRSRLVEASRGAQAMQHGLGDILTLFGFLRKARLLSVPWSYHISSTRDLLRHSHHHRQLILHLHEDTQYSSHNHIIAHQPPWRTSRSLPSMRQCQRSMGEVMANMRSMPAEFLKEGTLFMNRCTSTIVRVASSPISY